MATTPPPSFKVWDLSLAQAQTSNMNAQAHNAATPWAIQINGWTSVWSSGSFTPSAPTPTNPMNTGQTSSEMAINAWLRASSNPAPASVTNINNQNPVSGWSAPLGGAPVWIKTEKVKSFQNPATSAPSGTGNTLWVTSNPTPVIPPVSTSKSLLQIRDELKAQNPTAAPLDIMHSARQQYNAQLSVTNPNNNGIIDIKTGIASLDNELAKQKEESLQKIKDTNKNYALAQADYQKNAGYYTNFEWTNQKFNNILGDIQNTLTNSKSTALTDQQMAIIAAKNGVAVEDVKNPLNVYNNLQMTDEGKQVLGVTGRENQIADMVTNNDRAKEDAKTNLERNTTAINYQIADAQKQLQRNLDWATASGAWNGAARSSGYERGMKNLADDTADVVNRLGQQINNQTTDTSKYLSRLNEDFTNAMTRSKDSLDMDLKNLKFDWGLKLNGLSEKYGTWSKELLKALDAIQAEYGSKSLDIIWKYQDNVGKSISNMRSSIDMINTIHTVSEAMKNQRYNELTANGGALLQNISLSDIAKEVQAGHMDYQKYADTRNMMLSTVTTALGKTGVQVSQEMLNTITHLIDNGATPSQVIARVWGGNLQTPQIDATSIADYSTQKRGIKNADGTITPKMNLQCGELANDYWEQMTGSAISHDPAINTYQGKVSAIKKLGESPIPQIGWVFVLNTGNSTGHIGIVQQVNADGSIVVLEANRQNSTNGGAPMLGTYSAEQLKNMTFSKSPTDMNSTTQTVTPGSTQNRPDKNKNPWNLKWYGNDVLNIPGAVGVDDQNHIIFSNETDGYNAMVKDLTAKITGNSRQVSKLTGEPLWPNSTLADLASVYAEDDKWLLWKEWNGWVLAILKQNGMTDATKDTTLSQIDVNKLGPAIARQEGFTGKITAGATMGGKKEYSTEEKAIMDDYLKNPSDATNQKTMSMHNLRSNDITAYTNQKNTPQVPNASWFTVNDYIDRINNMLPAGMKDQPGESAKIAKRADEFMKSWITPAEAGLKYLWFNVKDKSNIETADNLRLAIQNVKNPPKWYEQKISDLVNSGNMKWANDFVNANIDRDVKDIYGDKAILTQNFETSQNRINKIVWLIQKNTDKIGAFDGRFTDLLKKVKDEPEYQELKTLLTMSQADIRKFFAWSAVTDTEMAALADFIGGWTNMTPNNLITQLRTIQEDVKNNYWFQRQVYWMGGNMGNTMNTTWNNPQNSNTETVDTIYDGIVNL